MSQVSIDLSEVEVAIRQLYIALEGKTLPSVWYDRTYNVIVALTTSEYRVPKQCTGKKAIVLFEENSENRDRALVGFSIRNVRELCAWYDVPMMGNKLMVSDILTALQKETIGLCGKVAIHMALTLLRKYQLDEITF